MFIFILFKHFTEKKCWLWHDSKLGSSETTFFLFLSPLFLSLSLSLLAKIYSLRFSPLGLTTLAIFLLLGQFSML